MQTTKRYVHLAGVVFREESHALERRLLSGLLPNGATESLQTPVASGNG